MSAPVQSVVVFAMDGVFASLRSVIDRIASLGIRVSVVDELDEAKEIIARSNLACPPVVVLSLPEQGNHLDETKMAQEQIRALMLSLPGVTPVVICADANPALLLACFRAGAADVVDIRLEGTALLRQIIDRVSARQLHSQRTSAQLIALRSMVEDFLRDLIRTERRSLALEEQLHARRRPSTSELLAAMDSDPDRQPTVLLVEDDRAVADALIAELEASGVATFAYLSGEDAVRECQAELAQGTWFDLALVDMRLPGIDGLDTIRGLRAHLPEIPAFLMTGYHDATTPVTAADLGVVGFVYKPFDDIVQLALRIRGLARNAMTRRREHIYLRRIKERHEKVLAQYQNLGELPAAAE